MTQNTSSKTCTKIDSFNEDYAFLSNFYPITIKGISNDNLSYATVEHYYQAMKTIDKYARRLVATASTPMKAKNIGRKLRLRKDWDNIKYDVMKKAIHAKFSDPTLRDKLLATGDAYLEEGNYWHDNIWGNCSCDACKNIIGQNWLGKILMEERAQLKKTQSIKGDD